MSAISTATNVDRYLDDVESSLTKGLLPVKMFNDKAVFDAELDRIFGRGWVFVAHESEIPNKGDYVLRRIGLDPVIVTRDNDDNINVMSSHCRHRGTEVCISDKGNAQHFTCPYHGWSYRLNGEWAGAPQFLEAYGGRLDKKEWGLLKAPHVGVRAGLIFASLDPDAPPLDQFLGGMGWMLDAFFGLSPRGMRVIAPPERTRVRADWKSGAENFAGDVYHVLHLHVSVASVMGAIHDVTKNTPNTRTYEFENGHGAAGHDWAKISGAEAPFGFSPPHFIEQYDLDRLDEAQLEMMRDKPPTVGTIFPNLSFIRFAAFRTLEEPPVILTSIRQWQPIGPGEIELWNWQLAWNFLDEEEVERTYNISQYSFGSAGIFEQDDTVAWEGIARAGASRWWRDAGAKFHFQAREAERSKVDQSPDPNWKGPGVHRLTGFGEYPQLNFYRQWLKAMRQEGGK